VHAALRQASKREGQSTNRQACTCRLPAPRPPPALPSAELSPGGNKTFFDIGCNKGYTSAHYFGLWAPNWASAPLQWWQSIPNWTVASKRTAWTRWVSWRADLAC
jgi:hypothetical protein